MRLCSAMNTEHGLWRYRATEYGQVRARVVLTCANGVSPSCDYGQRQTMGRSDGLR